jgi:hypothetical protein
MKEMRFLDWGLSLVERIEIVNLYAPLFKRALASAKFASRNEGYASKIVNDQVPDEFLMDYSKMKAAFSIGRLPQRSDVPEELRLGIWE